jgi:hypothetical protein
MIAFGILRFSRNPNRVSPLSSSAGGTQVLPNCADHENALPEGVETMFLSPKAWLWIVGICSALLGLLFNWETGLPIMNYFSSDDAQIRSTLSQRAAQHVALELSQTPMLSTGRPSVAVATTVDDYRGTVTVQLKTWLSRRNVSVINEQQFFSPANLFNRRPTSVADAIKPYLDGAADYIVAADVDNWTTYPEYEAKLIGTVYLFDGHGEQLAQMPLTPAPETAYYRGFNRASMESTPEFGVTTEPANQSDSGTQGVDEQRRSSPPIAIEPTAASDWSINRSSDLALDRTVDRALDRALDRASSLQSGLLPGIEFAIIAWLGFVFMGPWILRAPIRKILYRRDNRANVQMLLGWSGLCGGTLWILMALGGISMITTAVSLIAAVISCSYFAYVCEKFEESL